MILIPAALGNPSREVEYSIIVFGCLGARLAERPAAAVAAGTADPGGGRPRRDHRRPGARLAPDHPFDPRSEPGLRIAVLRRRQRTEVRPDGPAAGRRRRRPDRTGRSRAGTLPIVLGCGLVLGAILGSGQPRRRSRRGVHRRRRQRGRGDDDAAGPHVGQADRDPRPQPGDRTRPAGRRSTR